MKLLYNLFLIVFLIVNINFSYCQTAPNKIVEPAQNATALMIIKALYGVDANQVVEICDWKSSPSVPSHFSCIKMNNVDQYYSISSFSLYNQIGNHNFNYDISSFVNLTQANFNSEGIIVGPWFYANLNLFTQLKTIYVQRAVGVISETTILPDSLISMHIGQLETKLGLNWFNSKSLTTLRIDFTTQGFEFPSALNAVSPITYMDLPVSPFTNFPSNAAKYLTNLKTLKVTIYNDLSMNGYQNFSIPSFGPMKSLTDLEIIFYNERDGNNQNWIFPQDLLLLTSLTRFTVRGFGFNTNEEIGFTDFSNFPSLGTFFFQAACGFFDCKSTKCIKFPQQTLLTTSECPVNFNSLDFNTLSSLTMFYNPLKQNLPNDIGTLKEIEIQLSSVVGNIPESFCGLKMILQENELNGTVPACVLCQGGKYSDNLFPNQYQDFTETTPSVCNDISIDQDYNQLVSTDGKGSLIITGTQLGWDVVKVGGSKTDAEFIVPNSKFSIKIGKGVGINRSTQVYIHNNNLMVYTFNYSYIPPVIVSYDLIDDGGGYFYLQIIGTNFDYNNQNVLSINGIEQVFTMSSDIGAVNSYQDVLPSGIASGDTFKVSITVGEQTSPTVDFIYFPGSIEFDELTDQIQLNNTGGSVSLAGSFLTTDTKYVSVSINGIPCTVLSVTTNQLNIQYPTSTQLGEFTLTVTIGGRVASTDVVYIITPTPIPTVTPSTTTTTSTTTTSSNSNSQNSDDVSNSSILSISMTTSLFSSILLVCLFI